MVRKAFAAVIATSVLAAFVLAASVLAPSAVADESTTPNDEARFSFYKVTDGFLRLDRETGEVALCSQQATGWECQAAAEDRAALESEIARLRRDNAALKADLLARGLSLPPGTTEEPPPAGGGKSNGHSVTIRLPDSSDFDRVMLLFGRLWHRFVEVIASAQNKVLHRS